LNIVEGILSILSEDGRENVSLQGEGPAAGTAKQKARR
jgi:hypothetical protein